MSIYLWADQVVDCDVYLFDVPGQSTRNAILEYSATTLKHYVRDRATRDARWVVLGPERPYLLDFRGRDGVIHPSFRPDMIQPGTVVIILITGNAYEMAGIIVSVEEDGRKQRVKLAAGETITMRLQHHPVQYLSASEFEASELINKFPSSFYEEQLRILKECTTALQQHQSAGQMEGDRSTDAASTVTNVAVAVAAAAADAEECVSPARRTRAQQQKVQTPTAADASTTPQQAASLTPAGRGTKRKATRASIGGSPMPTRKRKVRTTREGLPRRGKGQEKVHACF